MPLSVNFRWKTPFVEAPKTDWEKNNTNESMKMLADSVLAAKKRRFDREQYEYKKSQDARRNAIEDEDVLRRRAEEDRKIQSQKDTAELIRGRKAQREQLVAQREQILQRIQQLEAQLGG